MLYKNGKIGIEVFLYLFFQVCKNNVMVFHFLSNTAENIFHITLANLNSFVISVQNYYEKLHLMLNSRN